MVLELEMVSFHGFFYPQRLLVADMSGPLPREKATYSE